MATRLTKPLSGAEPHLGATPRRVVVAMSGGVDSSLVAALMKEAGHEVIGITLQLYDHGEAVGRKGSCCAGQDIHDARQVADRLGIAHYVLDYEKRFAASVMRKFADSYVAGETPVPCITCNQEIKFRDLLETARELGADVLATGHYIRRIDGPAGPRLVRAVDAARDQSYFLFATTREQLSHLWFPLGGLTKSHVRDLARGYGLAVADKHDSQDICFVPSGRYTGVVERLSPGALRPGRIVHVDGRDLGPHEGIVNYTIGQRRGLGIASGEPLFVVKLVPDRNEVVVGPRDCLRTSGVIVRDVNWLDDDGFITGDGRTRDIFARMRSTQAPRPAAVRVEPEGRLRVELRDGEDGIAAGQACVFYSDESADARVLGGGWIARTISAEEATGSAEEATGTTSLSGKAATGRPGDGPRTKVHRAG